jgi:hypothetical protein
MMYHAICIAILMQYALVKSSCPGCLYSDEEEYEASQQWANEQAFLDATVAPTVAPTESSTSFNTWLVAGVLIGVSVCIIATFAAVYRCCNVDESSAKSVIKAGTAKRSRYVPVDLQL